MNSRKIRVGIIGAGGWAKYGHIPALRTLDAFEIVAVASRTKKTAESLAAEFDIPHAFDDHHDLIADPDVDLVVILAPGPEHARLSKAAIEGGKDVCSEWPLTTSTVESEELLALAEAKGVRHVIGLQRRFAPSARYARDLVQHGYVGKIRGVRMSVGVDAFPARMSERHAWTIDTANFTHVLSIYGGHFGDLLFHTVGFPAQLTVVVKNQFPSVTIEETGEKVPYASPNEVMVIGTLEGGGLFSVQLEGAQRHRTGLQIDITGTDGVLRITNPRSFEKKDDNTVTGMTEGAASFSPLPVPAEYETLAKTHLDASVQDVAYLYAAHARDRQNGTSEASDFKDAVRMHHVIDQISSSSDEFLGRNHETTSS
jgi:predicted dehydrogenase